ncbi:integrase core domain protein [Nephila pilipes]|uniref:Integrase core domain protein n=1 Tax=Nephila pilipes TaxID=299642 RepID=A0A8X6PLY3_NEPPI|nr:integrase core domain protein [Nephila pilipes]
MLRNFLLIFVFVLFTPPSNADARKYIRIVGSSTAIFTAVFLPAGGFNVLLARSEQRPVSAAFAYAYYFGLPANQAVEPAAAKKDCITAADLLNDRVIPFFDEQKVSLLRILTDRGTEYCGRPENHAYQLYLGVENIDHSRTKARSPQTNGICERFHRTMQDECYNIIFRKKIYTSLAELQLDVDHWVHSYNRSRPHSGKYCYGKTPMQTFYGMRCCMIDRLVALTGCYRMLHVINKSYCQAAPVQNPVRSRCWRGTTSSKCLKRPAGFSVCG